MGTANREHGIAQVTRKGGIRPTNRAFKFEDGRVVVARRALPAVRSWRAHPGICLFPLHTGHPWHFNILRRTRRGVGDWRVLVLAGQETLLGQSRGTKWPQRASVDAVTGRGTSDNPHYRGLLPTGFMAGAGHLCITVRLYAQRFISSLAQSRSGVDAPSSYRMCIVLYDGICGDARYYILCIQHSIRRNWYQRILRLGAMAREANVLVGNERIEFHTTSRDHILRGSSWRHMSRAFDLGIWRFCLAGDWPDQVHAR